jgi:hypothetical protein
VAYPLLWSGQSKGMVGRLSYRSHAISGRARRALVVGPLGEEQELVVRELADLGFGVLRTSYLETALVLVRTANPDAVVVQLSRFRTKALRQLVRGLLAHPDVALIGAMSVFSVVDLQNVTCGRAARQSGGGRRCSWRIAVTFTGFASPLVLSEGLASTLN